MISLPIRDFKTRPLWNSFKMVDEVETLQVGDVRKADGGIVDADEVVSMKGCIYRDGLGVRCV